MESAEQFNQVHVAEALAVRPQVIDNSLHSQYVTVLVEQGIVGLTVFIVFVIAIFLPPLRLALRTRSRLAAVLAAAIVIPMITMTTGTSLLDLGTFALWCACAGFGTTLAASAARSRPSTVNRCKKP